jgi:CPA2 family monovalent cation:H+ antiporter-2
VSVLDQPLVQVVLLLGLGVLALLGFRRAGLPSVLAYLLVGVLVGPHTMGPVVDLPQLRILAEFGVVFLLFTIGLNFSLPQIRALRHQILWLGTAQVALTTLTVGFLAWLAGVPAIAAFVVGAVFAQSSTIIIVRQLAEQGEEHARHGRLGTAMSVFQDVTAAPIIVIIPALAAAVGAFAIAGSVVLALGKAVLAFVLLFGLGRLLLRPLFHLVAGQRSPEVFTLSVLLVTLLAAWTSQQLGLSLAFGAFLAGMVLGETEFRAQVESTIRPFRDVLLGLFFVGIGMLFDPWALPGIWHWALAGALVLMATKALLVALLAAHAGLDRASALRTGLVLAVGGEFGFALLAIGLDAGAIDASLAQIVLSSVLLSLLAGPFLIRHGERLSRWLQSASTEPVTGEAGLPVGAAGRYRDHVILCGYGRIGQNVGHFLEEEGIPFVAVDLDASIVRDARLAGEPVYFGHAGDPHVLEALGLMDARMVVISHDDLAAALRTLSEVRQARPDLPVMVRVRDERHAEALRRAGATEVFPETLEAGLMIASHVLLLLGLPSERVLARVEDQRHARFRLLREFFRGDTLAARSGEGGDRLHAVALPAGAAAVGRRLGDIDLAGTVVTALVRDRIRHLSPAATEPLAAGDVLVLFGPPEALARAERRILG